MHGAPGGGQHCSCASFIIISVIELALVDEKTSYKPWRRHGSSVPLTVTVHNKIESMVQVPLPLNKYSLVNPLKQPPRMVAAPVFYR